LMSLATPMTPARSVRLRTLIIPFHVSIQGQPPFLKCHFDKLR
jgi:hypothetical protein